MYLKNYIQISFICQILSILFKHIKILKGAHGVEPWTSRSAVECSTTELYPLIATKIYCYHCNDDFLYDVLSKTDVIFAPWHVPNKYNWNADVDYLTTSIQVKRNSHRKSDCDQKNLKDAIQKWLYIPNQYNIWRNTINLFPFRYI